MVLRRRLFIVDFWILVTLAMGYVWSRRATSVRPARAALAALTGYTAIMLVITGVGRARVTGAYPGHRILVEPNPIVPWQRDVLIDEPLGYRFGSFSLLGGVRTYPQMLPKADTGSAVHRARQLPQVRRFLTWARFPMYRVSNQSGRTVVWVGDARYEGADWASITVALP